MALLGKAHVPSTYGTVRNGPRSLNVVLPERHFSLGALLNYINCTVNNERHLAFSTVDNDVSRLFPCTLNGNSLSTVNDASILVLHSRNVYHKFSFLTFDDDL
jgi:hypothetical protein